ncbi:uncharacterized protein TRIADDRAFT_19885, partial [Trichoplax adhaerens]
IHQLVSRYIEDRDSRVRTSALQSMLTLHSRGIKLELPSYDRAVQSIKDDYEDVRINAMKMIWAISMEYSDSFYKSLLSGEENKLADEGFIKICGMMTDLSMKVRVEAAKLLGIFHPVSFKYLEQTLDKKIMSHLQKRKSDHEKKIERVKAGESAVSWSSGRVWKKDAPKPELTVDDVNLMESGACGAFVHGLEDEFMEVRIVTVESMCLLGQRYEPFAHLLTDFIVDMLNDEIESVRLAAIHCLKRLAHKITLRDDQLNIVLDLLKDRSTEIRNALRILLRSLHFTTVPPLQFGVQALIRNLHQYREDQLSIWECLKDLGKDHGYLIMSFITDLLSLHPYFATSEADISDPSHIGIAIFIFSASTSYPLLVNYFPQFLFKHYSYLKDKYPDLVPISKVCK